MPTPTYTPLANVTLGSAASSVTFGSIPATYGDLICVVVATGSTSLAGRLRLNGDTGTNYHFQRMSGSGSTTTGANGGFASVVLSDIARATTTGALQININIMDYSATNKEAIIIGRAGNAENGTEAFANGWDNTAAVTSVQIFTSTGNWAAGSTFALYGVIA
jgi:predicted Abi (CAAX) family protease